MSELYSLYKLHQVDSTLYGLRKEAASLDTGKGDMALIKATESEHTEAAEQARLATSELRDLELQQKSYEEKLKALDKTLYDGSIVSPREVENIEKDIAMYKGLAEKNDERLLELYDEAPPLQVRAKSLETSLQELKASVEEKKVEAVRRHGEIKVEFDRLKSERPDYVSQVGADLLEMYEDIRKRTGSVAMATVTEGKTCDQCGLEVPEKTLLSLRTDHLQICEGCHRILFRVLAEA